MKSFLEWVVTAAVLAARETMASIEVKSSERKSALRMSQFINEVSLAFHELKTEQTCQVLRALQVFPAYALKGAKLYSFSFTSFAIGTFLFLCLLVCDFRS